MPPGHEAVVVEDLKIMDFSPQQAMLELIDHVEKKLAKQVNWFCCGNKDFIFLQT